MDASLSELLTGETVGGYLAARGIPARDAAEPLAGGVGNVVLAVRAQDGRELVVKQSLERLRVAAEWHAPKRRILSEAAGLATLRSLDADAAPAVVDVDPERMVLVLERAPEGAEDWKAALLRGEADPVVAARLGRIVGLMHRETAGRPLPALLEDDPEAFEALRLDPYHGEVARRLPGLAARVREVADGIRATRVCLVHGDLSPKNVLVLPDGRVWLIDFEVAHRGDPVFDLAFLLSHLVLKAMRRPEAAERYVDAADAFLAAYRESRGAIPPDAELLPQLACLLLARVVGKSPVDYLDSAQRDAVLAIGTRLLGGAPPSLAALLDQLRRLS